MRLTLDTNVVVYAFDDRDGAKHAAAKAVILAARGSDCVIGVQCCGELYAALTRRLRRPAWEAGLTSRNLMVAFDCFAPTSGAVEAALVETMAGRFSYWDALLLASAREAGCDYCLSEDMHDGARLGGVEVVNPFCPTGISERAAAILNLRKE